MRAGKAVPQKSQSRTGQAVIHPRQSHEYRRKERGAGHDNRVPIVQVFLIVHSNDHKGKGDAQHRRIDNVSVKLVVLLEFRFLQHVAVAEITTTTRPRTVTSVSVSPLVLAFLVAAIGIAIARGGRLRRFHGSSLSEIPRWNHFHVIPCCNRKKGRLFKC